MSDSIGFFVVVFGIGLGAFVITSIFEIVLLKRSKKLVQIGVTKYVLASNVIGIIAMSVFAGLLAATALLFFSATMGGAFWVSLLSVLFLIVLLILTPLLMFGGRQLVSRLLGISKDQLSWIYAAAVAVLNFVFVIVFIFGVFVLFTAISQGFAN